MIRLLTLISFWDCVVVHEFGHFYFAKKSGILVREFAIGMGPRFFSISKDGTTYTIQIFSGGYVSYGRLGVMMRQRSRQELRSV